MKESARPVVWQPKLPLFDIPALTTPRQQELSQALMNLLVHAARPVASLPPAGHQEDPNGCQADV
jgi:hypothetical protein